MSSIFNIRCFQCLLVLWLLRKHVRGVPNSSDLGVPPPANIRGIVLSSTAILLMWDPPAPGADKIVAYTIHCHPTGDGAEIHDTVSGQEFVFELRDLLPFTTYAINVQSWTEKGPSIPTEMLVTTHQASTNLSIPTVSPLMTTKLVNAEVRLVGSTDPMAGRVEIFANNQWGTICDDFFDFTVADIICRQLGYTYAMALDMAHFGEGTGPIFGFDSCPTTATTIQECVNIEDKKNCFHFEDAGVVCNNAWNPKDFDIRLIGSIHKFLGFVQVYYQGQWGYICDNGYNWDMREAHIICKELGYEKAFSEVTEISNLIGLSSPYVISNIVCTGSEISLKSCDLSLGNYCDGMAASILCSEKQTGGEPSYNIRLGGGSDSSEGRVEIFIDGEWGFVCDDQWTTVEAFVVCRQLGFEYAISALTFSYFGEGDGLIKLDDVACSGVEDDLFLCKHPGVGLHNCHNSEQAGVKCSNVSAPPIGSRIVLNSCSKNLGHVQVYHNKLMWRICNTGWDDNDARVVCRMKNYKYGFSMLAPFDGEAQYRSNTLAAYIDQVDCYGNETSLADCHLGVVKPFKCPYYNDAAVYCTNDSVYSSSAKQRAEKVNYASVQARLTGSIHGNNEGRVEVYANNRWQKVCSVKTMLSDSQEYTWPSLQTANVICRQLKFEKAVVNESIELLHEDANPNSINAFIAGLMCNGTEDNLSQCQHQPLPFRPLECPQNQYPVVVRCIGYLPCTTDDELSFDEGTLVAAYGVLFIFCLATFFCCMLCLFYKCRWYRSPSEWWPVLMNKLFCWDIETRPSRGQSVMASVNEPWAPRTSSHQGAEVRRWSLTLEVNGRTLRPLTPPEPPPPPPSYIHVIENPQDFPLYNRGGEGYGESDSEGEMEDPPPSYSRAINERPQVREELM